MRCRRTRLPTCSAWRDRTLTGRKWFDDHGVSFGRHYTGSLACVPSRPTIFTGHYPDLHGVTQTDGIGKTADDSRMRWLRQGEVPTLGNWFRAAGYDTHYDGKWHISHADLIDPATGGALATNDDDGVVECRRGTTLLGRGSAGAVRLFRMGRPRAARRGAGRRRRSPRRSDRRPRCRLAHRPLRPPSRRRPRRAASVPAGRQLREPPRHRAVSSMVAAKPGQAVTTRIHRQCPRHPTADEDLSTKPAAQIAFREAYYSGYGPAPAINWTYERNAQRYRDLYYRLHAEVDGPIDRVRRAVTEGGSDNAVLVRTADHGDLLGAHGGLHQKWFNLYDEATRVPFVIARIGERCDAAPGGHGADAHMSIWSRRCWGPPGLTSRRSPPRSPSHSRKCTSCPAGTSCRSWTARRPTRRGPSTS